MPTHELDALRREASGVLTAWLIIAAAAGIVALVIRTSVQQFRLFPPQRVRSVAWSGSLVAAAFLVYYLVPAFILPYIDRVALARQLSASDLTDQAARLLAYCAAETLSLPFQVAAWGGLLLLAGRPIAIGWHARRLAGDYLAGFRAWLVLTPIVYAVGFAAAVGYRLVAGESPAEHPIVQAFQKGPVSAGFVTILILQAVVVAPIKEELFFRGIVQPWLTSKSWGGDLSVWLAAIVGLAIRAPAAGPVTDLRTYTSTLAPVLFVFAALPAYRLIDRSAMIGWLPVRDPIARHQAARAIVGTSLLFANLHANVWPTPIPLFVLALGLGWLAYRTGGVTAPIVVHMLFNAIVFAALGLQPAPPPVAPV